MNTHEWADSMADWAVSNHVGLKEEPIFWGGRLMGISSLPPVGRSEYLDELLQAKLKNYYVPEVEDVYLREENFQTPSALAMDFGY
jgi:hypothetical protein